MVSQKSNHHTFTSLYGEIKIVDSIGVDSVKIIEEILDKAKKLSVYEVSLLKNLLSPALY